MITNLQFKNSIRFRLCQSMRYIDRNWTEKKKVCTLMMKLLLLGRVFEYRRTIKRSGTLCKSLHNTYLLNLLFIIITYFDFQENCW